MTIVQLHVYTSKQFLNPMPTPNIAHLDSQKIKKHPKNKSKSKVRTERNIANISCSTTCVDLKTVFESYSDSQKSPKRTQEGGTLNKSFSPVWV